MKKNSIYWTILSPMIIHSINQRYGDSIACMVKRDGKRQYE